MPNNFATPLLIPTEAVSPDYKFNLGTPIRIVKSSAFTPMPSPKKRSLRSPKTILEFVRELNNSSRSKKVKSSE